MAVETLLKRFEVIRKNGHGKWMVGCLFHDDRRPSLSIREMEDGKVLVHCFGCGAGAADVIEALGLSFSDLYPPSAHYDSRRAPTPRTNLFDPLAALHGLAHEALVIATIAEDMRALGWSQAHDARLAVAVGRINGALDYVAEDRNAAKDRRRMA